MKKALASLLAVGALAFVPQFAHAEETIVDAGGAAYIVVDDSGPSAQVWQETNGEAGLQRTGNNPDTKIA